MKTSHNSSKCYRPTFLEENELSLRGFKLIAGIDEAGIGALAGPVVAAAVILPEAVNTDRLSEVHDSKKIPPAKREILYEIIREAAVSTGVGIIQPSLIDSANIYNATKLAICHAIRNLVCVPDHLLIDGTIIPGMNIRQKNIIKGDQQCISIACASIIAKVTRDRIMCDLDKQYPEYGFNVHKGYCTRYHMECLDEYGPSPIHRFSYTPVKRAMRLL